MEEHKVKNFRIHWTSGSRSASGVDIYDACKKAGISEEELKDCKYWEVTSGVDDNCIAQYGTFN